MARGVLSIATQAHTHTDMYSFTNSTYPYCAWWTLFYLTLFFATKKNSGHDPLNWFRDPLNWFLNPLMCHDRQFEKHWPDPIPAPPPPPRIGEMGCECGEKWDWDKHKEEGGRNAKKKKKKQDKGKNGNEMKQKRKDGKWETAFQKAHSGLAGLCLCDYSQAPQSFWPFWQESSLSAWMAIIIRMLSACLSDKRFPYLSAPLQITTVALREKFLSAAQGPGPQKDLECIG